MHSLILSLHLIVCILIILVVLLQSGKEGMGVILGGSNTSVFGSSGAGGFLAKLTAILAFIFVVTSLSYTIISNKKNTNQSVVIDVQIEEPVTKQTEQTK